MLPSEEPDASEYHSVLTSIGEDGLWNEKGRIAANIERLTEASRELAFANYPTFIASAECCKAIADDFESNQKQLNELEEKIPNLLETFKRFQQRSTEISGQRKRTSLVLSKHTKVLEVLELPQLLETCVRNSHYEEALGIQQLATKLGKPPRGSIPLVGSVLRDIETSSEWMLSQLLGKLRGQITLPECLRVVGFIRRMAVYSESELRLKFLQARELYFDSVLSATSRSQIQQSEVEGRGGGGGDAYALLCRVTEVTRVSVFDTVTQYRALFSDDDVLLSGGESAATLAHISYRQIFSAWIFKRVQIYKITLKTTLASEELEEQALDSLLGQVMYFGQSLGRVGFDFRPQFLPIFTSVILQKCELHLKRGMETFEGSLKNFSLPTTFSDSRGGDCVLGLDAPSSLLVHHPLAEVSNAIAMTANELRHCAPVVVAFPVFDMIQKLLDAVSETLLRQERKSVACESEGKIAKSLIRCFICDLVPYSNRCYRNIFPEKFISKMDSTFKEKRDLHASAALRELADRTLTPEPVLVEERDGEERSEWNNPSQSTSEIHSEDPPALVQSELGAQPIQLS